MMSTDGVEFEFVLKNVVPIQKKASPLHIEMAWTKAYYYFTVNEQDKILSDFSSLIEGTMKRSDAVFDLTKFYHDN